MSEVDLSKAKKGDKVKFRCGGEAVIKAAYKNNEFEYGFSFEGDDGTPTLYHRNANPDGKGIGPHPFQIIAIEPAPFDWSTVKAGMAFREGGHMKNYYVGPHPLDSAMAIFFEEANSIAFKALKSKMVRDDRCDIEVQS